MGSQAIPGATVPAEAAPIAITRLQLGISYVRNLSPAARDVFLDPSWLHYGDAGEQEETNPGVSGAIRKIKRSLRGETPPDVAGHLARSNFEPFHYEKGDRLPFDDASLDFIFSEHFLAHLFLDEAIELLRECARILRPRGVLRLVVPDADLRTYEPPEDAGCPGLEVPWNHPDKHKTRWSVYSLSPVLEIVGFVPVPLHYCDRDGRYVQRDPSEAPASYEGSPDRELVFDLSYVMRPNSLIVDGVRHPLSGPAATG